MIKQDFDRVLAYVDAHQDELTEELRTLVRVPSVRGEAEPGAPYGRECARALEVTREIFAAHGVEAKIWPEGGYLIAEVGKGERCFGLFAHSDVVPVDDAWTLGDPFCADVRDGFVIGRGTRDNKCGIVASLYAALAIRDLGIPFRNRIWLVVGSAEESRMVDMRAFAREQPMPDVCLVPDMCYPVCRGEKGILRFWAVSKDRLNAVRAFTGGDAPNVVLGKAEARFAYSPALAAALDGLGERFDLRREGDELVLTATGLSHHGAAPEGSVNAARLLTGVLAACSALPEGDRDLLSRADALLEGYYGEGMCITYEDSQFGKLTCSNGMARLRDGRLALSFDVRYGTECPDEELDARIRKRLDEMGFELDLSLGGFRPGFLIPEDDPTLCRLLDCYAAVTGTQSPKAKLAGGGTYARELKRAYSTAAYEMRPSPFRVPEGHGAPHQPDEHVPLDGVSYGAAMLAAMLITLDQAK